MKPWEKQEIEIAGGAKVMAQMPLIVSASRSTDVPAFYSDWFIERLEAGYVKWFNPFNGVPLYVSLNSARLFVFWSKNPAPMLKPMQGRKESPLDILDARKANYYFQFTMNDYDAEKIEPRVPRLEERIETFKALSQRIGRDRVIWRFDPLILSDSLTVEKLLEKIERLGDKIVPFTSRFVFSFIDIAAYRKVAANLERGGIKAREFKEGEMEEIAARIGELSKGWGIKAGTCGEIKDLERFGVEHNRCIDDRLMVKCFSHDAELMKFIGAKFVSGDTLFSIEDKWEPGPHKKDPGQRLACGCIMSKDIGEYNTCPHLCHYCYANTNNAAAMANWKRHCANSHGETIMRSSEDVHAGEMVYDEIDVAQFPISVTFDSNVIEEILDAKKRAGDSERIVFKALQNGIIQGFVAHSYFAHDAIQKDGRIAALCDDVEFRIPANPFLYSKGIGLTIEQTARTKLNEHNKGVLRLLRELNMGVLDFRRKLWPGVETELPTRKIPADFNERVRKVQKVIEEELHCGFYRFRAYLKEETGGHGDDFSLIVRLRDREYSKGAFNAAFAEAADGDALIAHYGYGISYFCTNDRAAKAGGQSVFSQSNRSLLRERLGIRIVCPAELANIIEGALYGR